MDVMRLLSKIKMLKMIHYNTADKKVCSIFYTVNFTGF